MRLRLYHYTSLYHLAPIMREGIRLGEIPLDGARNVHGPNFTTSVNYKLQAWARGSIADKTKVRIVVEIEKDDPKLKHWKTQVWKGEPKELRRLDEYGQAKWWYVYVDGVVSPDRFTEVGIREGEIYRPIHGDELAALVAKIDEERAKIMPGETDEFVRGDPDSWLFDGHDYDGRIR
jgi:hypothetical protein